MRGYCRSETVRAMMTLRFAAATRRIGRVSWRNIESDAKAATNRKKTIQQLATEIDLRGKSVLVRADLNLPRSKEDGTITDDTRARAVSIPNICGYSFALLLL